MDTETKIDSSSKSQITLQVRFTTKQEQYAVPDYPFALAANVGSEELNTLVNSVLKEDGVVESKKNFDFLIGGEFLRGTLEELVLRHEALKGKATGGDENDEAPIIGVEEIVEVEYVERTAAPEPEDCLLHDDWVSAVDATDQWILTGSYDCTLHLWTNKGKHKQGFPAHSGPVKTVSWVSHDSKSAVFASGSHDQTVMIWEWDLENNNVSCKWVCKGHERSVEALQVDPDGTMIASGSWDGHLKIWSASITEEKRDNVVSDLDGAVGGTDTKVQTRTPIMTLAGHKECISAVNWSEQHELITSSWDHTIKIWDAELGGIKSEIAGNKAFFDLCWSPLNKTAITASADRHIRLYDPRSSEGTLVKALFTSHSGWVSSVNWSTNNENLFISGSHDKLMKLWDRRSPRAPLYDMTGHTENVLCTSWANPNYMMSGGSDNTLRVFKSKSL